MRERESEGWRYGWEQRLRRKREGSFWQGRHDELVMTEDHFSFYFFESDSNSVISSTIHHSME
jgi:hypothetical protein